MADIEHERHALYRFFDDADRLLYIGITANPGRRFGQHSTTKPWWEHVTTIRMHTYPDRRAVLAAERDAIQHERPLHNIHHAAAGAAAHVDPELPGDAPGEWPVAAGDVVALGLHDRTCPVGLVDTVTQWGPRVTKMSFLDGTFDQDTITVPWSQIAEIRHARPKRADELDGTGEEQYAASGRIIWHTTPLGDFQTGWVHGRERMLADRAFWANWGRS